jgi:hypothetical protein
MLADVSRQFVVLIVFEGLLVCMIIQRGTLNRELA